MQLSKVQEDSVLERKLFLGIENFKAVAVNPTLQELNDMGIPATTEPEYLRKIKRDFGDGEKEYDAVDIRIYLDNEDENNSIKTQVNYTIIDAYHFSSTNKVKVINKYGNTTWLEEAHVKAGTLPSNMQWYVNDGVKYCYRGEDELISFLKAYRNLPNISLSSTEDTMKKGIVLFEKKDLDKLFKGDFTDIKNVILSVKDESKVGFLLGVRHSEDKDYQTLYKQSPLKRYVKKAGNTQYLVKDVNNSLQNGGYSTSTFDLDDLNLKVFKPEDKVDADDDFSDYGAPVMHEEDDDLPF